MALDPFSIIGSAVAGYLGSAMGTAMGTVIGSVAVYQDLAPQEPAAIRGLFCSRAEPDVYTWDGEEAQTDIRLRP